VGRCLALVLASLLAACVSAPQPVEELPPPRPKTQSAQPLPAVLGLVEQGRRQMQAGNWQAAIASAERGLRIDRREPELYLLLAQGYLALGENARALEFARQGRRYLHEADSALARQLADLQAALESMPSESRL